MDDQVSFCDLLWSVACVFRSCMYVCRYVCIWKSAMTLTAYFFTAFSNDWFSWTFWKRAVEVCFILWKIPRFEEGRPGVDVLFAGCASTAVRVFVKVRLTSVSVLFSPAFESLSALARPPPPPCPLSFVLIRIFLANFSHLHYHLIPILFFAVIPSALAPNLSLFPVDPMRSPPSYSILFRL